jgi:hypothetical protein
MTVAKGKYEHNGEWKIIGNGTPISHLLPENYGVCSMCNIVYDDNSLVWWADVRLCTICYDFQTRS